MAELPKEHVLAFLQWLESRGGTALCEDAPAEPTAKRSPTVGQLVAAEPTGSGKLVGVDTWLVAQQQGLVKLVSAQQVGSTEKVACFNLTTKGAALLAAFADSIRDDSPQHEFTPLLFSGNHKL